MIGGLGDESDFEAYDEADYEADYEGYDEAGRPRRRPTRPMPTGSRRSTYQPRPTTGANVPVTEARFRAALQRIDQRHNTHSTALRTLDGRVRNLAAEQNRLSTTTRRELAAVRRDLQSTREMIALIQLLFPAGSGGTAASLAPLLLLLPPDFLSGAMGGGQSSSSQTSSSQGVLGNNGLVTLVAVAAASGLFNRP